MDARSEVARVFARRGAVAALASALACGGSSGAGPAQEDSGTTAGSTSTSGTSGSETAAGTEAGTGDPLPTPWEPGTAYPSLPDPNPRGFVDRRGPIHSHSPYSHDACDEEPRDAEGNIDAVCFEDLRRAMCQTRHDFLMLTDHRDSFSDSEFPDVLLYDPARADTLVERGGGPVANWAGCEGAPPVLVMAGCEAATMPVGLEGHVEGRGTVYGEATPEAIAAFKAQGAVSLVAHTEDWTVEQLSTLPLHGFEMYNLHANMLSNIAVAAQLVSLAQNDDPGLPHSDLIIFPLWAEDDRYLQRWGSVLAAGHRRVTTLGTDAHRNTIKDELPDGERGDSFRRMMLWFSNHLLVEAGPDGTWDDTAVKAALAAGRLYGAFEYMGYPQGFDAYVETTQGVSEIGSEVALADAPTIVATAPSVRELDPAVAAPDITLHLMRAVDGGFEEVASGDVSLQHVPTETGAYRVEVRIVPHHLQSWLGDFAADAAQPRVWIYANPFYVR